MEFRIYQKEVLTKELRDHLANILPAKEFFCRRAEGTIFVDRRPLVQVVVETEDEAKLMWKHSKRIALGLEDDRIGEQFKKIASEGGEPWS